METGESSAAAGCSLPQPFCPGTFADAQALFATSVQRLLLSCPVASDKISFMEKTYLFPLSFQNDSLFHCECCQLLVNGGQSCIDHPLCAELLTGMGASVADVFAPLPTTTTLGIPLRHFPSGNQMSDGSALPWRCLPGA